jgi:hypothetical protein
MTSAQLFVHDQGAVMGLSVDANVDDVDPAQALWVQWTALCRLYGPKKLFFDKTWKLPDIQGRADEPVTTIATLDGGGQQGVTHHPLDEPL